MTLSFAPGDNLVFQVESGFGLLRILAVEEVGQEIVWHLLAYEELFPDVETAEAALGEGNSPLGGTTHVAITNRGLEKTPAARLSNNPLTDGDRAAVRARIERGGQVFDRSVQSVLGLR